MKNQRACENEISALIFFLTVQLTLIFTTYPIQEHNKRRVIQNCIVEDY